MCKTVFQYAIGFIVCLSISADAADYNGGNGEPNTPYQINSAADWQTLMTATTDWSGKYFILTNNINLSGVTITPIGSSSTMFTGIFDGQRHVISNLTYSNSGATYVGLFGCTDTAAVIQNLGVENVSISGSGIAGGLVGQNKGTIQSCYSTGSVSAGFDVGGLAGRNLGAISSCYAVVSVNAANYTAGGLVGYDPGKINNCYATGAVTGNNYIGGLVGFHDGTQLSNCYATGQVKGSTNVGGLVGYLFIRLDAVYNACFWDIETSLINDGAGNVNPDPGWIFGRTTAQMRSIWTFFNAGWDFVLETINGAQDIWTISPGQYPTLTWQGGSYPDTAAIPDVVGMSHTDAQSAIESVGFVVGIVTTSYSDTVAAGSVISQSPAGGVIVFLGASVDVVISLGGYYSGGNGSSSNPYQIADANDWQILMTTSETWNKYFVLTADIDLAGIIVTPVGNNSTKFTGVFEGNGHTIRNVVISMPEDYYVGLFGIIYNSQIKNLGLENIDIQGNYPVGGLAGYTDLSMMTSCYVTGTVAGYSGVGGLAGYNNESNITACYTESTVSGIDYVIGGLVGNNNGGTVTLCYATGNVTGVYDVGGLMGDCGYSEISACYASGNVTSTGECIGGLVGYNYECTITTCYATGAVTGDNYVGGMLGYNDFNGNITNCYAMGNVTGTNNYIGGLVGYNSEGTIITCYAAGAVTGNSYVGGLCGYQYGQGSAAIENSFWDTSTSGQTVGYNPDPNYPGTITNVFGETTAEMQTLSTFNDVGWDFMDTWAICQWTNYPRLQWQIPTGDWMCPEGVEMEDLSLFAVNWLEIGNVSADVVDDLIVDMQDLSVISQNWMQTDCGDCGGADLTGDSSVDIQDILAFSELWLFEEDPDCQQIDINHSGRIDLADLSIFAANWLKGI